MGETLGDETRAPAERLMAYFDRIAESAAEAEWRRGCMVPDLAGEIAFHDDALRARLCAVPAQQSAQFEKVVRLIRPGDEDGAADLSAFLLAAWHGTLLRMKVERNANALDRFRRMLGASRLEFEAILSFAHGLRQARRTNRSSMVGEVAVQKMLPITRPTHTASP
jgi:TetR/AcrR family transcriptional regulator, transcriptional repressor for nem operon